MNVSSGRAQYVRRRFDVTTALWLAGYAWSTIADMTEDERSIRAAVYMAQLAVDRLTHAWPEPDADQAAEIAAARDTLRTWEEVAAIAGLEPWRSTAGRPTEPTTVSRPAVDRDGVFTARAIADRPPTPARQQPFADGIHRAGESV